jgi:hypothetical protein
LLDGLNEVRNEQSMAHDNPILNYEESLLVFNQVTSVLRFIRAIEKAPPPPDPDAIPF